MSWWRDLLSGKSESSPHWGDAAEKSWPVRRITLGVDFGTSSTKCCFREQRDRASLHVVGFAQQQPGDSHVLLPTTITIDAGRLYFGHAAEHHAGQKLRSFKMCLLCQAVGSHPEAAAAPDSCPCCDVERRGCFRVGGHLLSAEDLSTLYLAYVMQAAKTRVIQTLADERSELRVIINSAAPLDQMEAFGSVGELFERAVYYGERLSGVACDGWAVEEAVAALESVRRDPLTSPEDRLTRVFPETHAAMTAYLLLPQSEMGLYGLVDIGAGTTDVAFFWLQKDMSATTAWYYSAGSRRVGMDDVDRAIASAIPSLNGSVRGAREALSEAEIEARAPLIDPIANRVRKHQVAVLFDALKVDKRPKAWFTDGKALYRLFLVGGGAMCKPLIRPTIAAPPQHQTAWAEPPTNLIIPAATKVALADERVVSIRSLGEPAAERLLLLAVGLAHPRPDIPRFERDVEGVKGRLKNPPGVFELPDQWW